MNSYEDLGRRKLMTLQFFSGSVAACGAVTVTNPFDMLKTRRQLHNELGMGTRSIDRINLRSVWRVEGLRGVQKGLLPAYIYQTMMNGTRFMVYEPLRLFLVDQRKLESRPILCNALAGALAGGLAASLGSPFNLIKTRLQSHSEHFATGHQHGYPSTITAIQRIWSAEGIRGFYRGVYASMLRTTAGSAAQLSSYEWAKSMISRKLELRPDLPSVYLGSALVGGIWACLVMNPFDVIMTRLYNQKGTAFYAGVFDCGWKTVKSEGLLALWKGLVPHFIRVGPHTVLTLVLLEQVRTTLQPLFM